MKTSRRHSRLYQKSMYLTEFDFYIQEIEVDQIVGINIHLVYYCNTSIVPVKNGLIMHRLARRIRVSVRSAYESTDFLIGTKVQYSVSFILLPHKLSCVNNEGGLGPAILTPSATSLPLNQRVNYLTPADGGCENLTVFTSRPKLCI